MLLGTLSSSPAFAFDYLEHLWFTDDGCRRAQEALASQLEENRDLDAAYLALALACPTTWQQPYCKSGSKHARGHLNEVRPTSKRQYSATLGDFSALADHVSRQGPVQNLPRAGRRGLVDDMLTWLTASPGGVGGPIGDVAEDACETHGSDDLAGVGRDIDERLSFWWSEGKLSTVETRDLPAVVRDPIARGPHDPPMKYSFDNPHYLDLVLRNHHHFGESAHDAWNGFHGAATRMESRPCSDLIVVDADRAEDLADHVAGFEHVNWDEVPDNELSARVCAMLAEVVRGRIDDWAHRAPAALVKPAHEALDRMKGADLQFADRVVVRLLSLVFEGTGLHYLQDGLAAGHMRTIRSREALVEVRHDHDADNRDGVAATIQTPRGTSAFVAWGDGYLLGRAPASHCDWTSRDPAVVSTCLLRQQRGILAAATIASLVDWAYGGAVYRGLDCEDGLERAICMGLPLAAPRVAGSPAADVSSMNLLPGSLPVPPPGFSFESLSAAVGFAPWEATPFLSMRFATFAEMDIPAHWLRSWEFRLESDFGERRQQSLVTDLAFGFHYRFYARVMLDLVPVVFLGIRDFDQGTDVFAGVAPRFGLTFLPEGWVKIPVELTLYVDQPIVLFAGDTAAFSEVANSRPRAAVSFGLAFMH